MALGNGEVKTLFVAERPGDDRLAWFGAEQLCAADPTAGTAPGRLVDVAVRAALLTDAEVRVVAPGTVPDDIAALRRYG